LGRIEAKQYQLKEPADENKVIKSFDIGKTEAEYIVDAINLRNLGLSHNSNKLQMAFSVKQLQTGREMFNRTFDESVYNAILRLTRPRTLLLVPQRRLLLVVRPSEGASLFVFS
jgi:hypothetical protein